LFQTLCSHYICSFHFFYLLKNTNFTRHFKHSQRPSILADANSINQSLDNQLAFFTHLRIVFNLNLVNIKRLPPLIYYFNFSELFFTLFKKKIAKTELHIYIHVAINEQKIDCSEFPFDAWRARSTRTCDVRSCDTSFSRGLYIQGGHGSIHHIRPVNFPYPSRLQLLWKFSLITKTNHISFIAGSSEEETSCVP
jgi:hypothetical protein